MRSYSVHGAHWGGNGTGQEICYFPDSSPLGRTISEGTVVRYRDMSEIVLQITKNGKCRVDGWRKEAKGYGGDETGHLALCAVVCVHSSLAELNLCLIPNYL